MEEKWKQISEFDGWYEVSDLGQVRSYRTQGSGKRRKRPVILYGGVYRQNHHSFVPYHYVLLRSPSGKKAGKNVARLVLEAFVGPAPKGKEVSHLNSNSMDNRLDNLMWETHEKNMLRWTRIRVKGQRYKADQVRQWVKKRGARKINAEKVRRIRELLEQGFTIREVACRFNVAHQTIYNIARGKTWKTRV